MVEEKRRNTPVASREAWRDWNSDEDTCDKRLKDVLSLFEKAGVPHTARVKENSDKVFSIKQSVRISSFLTSR